MPRENEPDLAERDRVQLTAFPDGGPQKTIRTWSSYSFNTHFLTPSCGWHFELGGKTIDRDVFEMLVPGVKVQLTVNGRPQCTGRVDEIEVAADRSSGTILRVTGRDMLAQVVDGNADPQRRFTKDMTLAHVCDEILVKQFGFERVEASSDADRGVVTGQTRGQKRTKKGKPLKQYQLHQLQPYAHEGALAFLMRIAERHGLWMWCSADGKSVIVDVPDFESDPIFTLRRRTNAEALHNNVLSGTMRLSMREQPTHIVCDGYGGGAEFGHSRLRCFIGNPIFAAQNSEILDKYPGIEHLETDFTILAPPAIVLPHTRVIYLHDEESRTPKQLENFARRQLATRMQRGLVATYQVAGHTQNGAPWAVNEMVNVQDDHTGLHEQMWILSRTFMKDRHSGTRTQLELIRPGSLVF